MRLPLTQGAYSAQSVISNAQRCVNLYAERNPEDSPVPFTYYGAPGLVSLAKPPSPAPARGLFAANSGDLYYACGATVNYVSPDWVLHPIGTIHSRRGRASMDDNGTTLVLVDGTKRGWQIDLATRAFSEITNLTSAPDAESGGVFGFYGADRVDCTDGFMVLNQPGTRNFYSTYLNQIVFDSLYFAAKNGRSDDLVTLATTHRELVLIGQKSFEPWFNAGNPDFPFEAIPGAMGEVGCWAKHSIARAAGILFWLSRDEHGRNIIVRYEGHAAKRISNHAMEAEFSRYPRTDDAEAFCFQIGGHMFYQINFPSADKSWRWDEACLDQWHEAVWTDDAGRERRHRAACAAFAYGRNVCADWETGELYAFDLDADTDAGRPMVWRRGFPHLMGDGRMASYPGFVLDIECGTAPNAMAVPGPFPMLERGGPRPPDAMLEGAGSAFSIDFNDGPWLVGPPPAAPDLAAPAEIHDAGPDGGAILAGPAPPDAQIAEPQVWLRWSDDRGRTWGNPVPQSLGGTGEFKTQPQWNRTGAARDRVFEVYGIRSGRLAVNGAWLDPQPIVFGS